ncbi:hypothetical protein SJI00_02785 [Pseudomonas sp. RP23018S]|nr:hypothetical protein [Pseudomonas sp. RP23018S]
MIGENVPEQHEKARAELAASVAQFLARGGQIQQCSGVGSTPRRPSFRNYPDPQPAPVPEQPVSQLVTPPPPVPRVSATSHAHAANTQKAERFWKRQAKAAEREALIDRIRIYSQTKLSRDVVAKVLGISNQQLSKLITQYGIDFPKWRRSA